MLQCPYVCINIPVIIQLHSPGGSMMQCPYVKKELSSGAGNTSEVLDVAFTAQAVIEGNEYSYRLLLEVMNIHSSLWCYLIYSSR